MFSRFAFVAACAAIVPVAAIAAPYAPDFMIEDSPERNALAVMLWLLLIAVTGAVVMLMAEWAYLSRSATRRAAIEVERSRLRVRRRVL